MAQQIPLTRGAATLVDDQDYPQLAARRWFCTSSGYAARVNITSGKKQTVYMHRLIMNAPAHLQVDHINGDTLDNRRQNLRLVTPQQNRMNGKSTTGSSPYKGVSRYGKSWQARICANNKLYHLGYHDTPLTAALVYDHAARRFFGPFARLNHPEQPQIPYYDQLLDQILAGTRPPRKPHRAQVPPVPKACSRYRGVYWERGRWRAAICIQRHKHHIGYFTDEVAAARAYDAIAKARLGERARLNFP